MATKTVPDYNFQEKKKCDCIIMHNPKKPGPNNYVEDCKCELEANFPSCSQPIVKKPTCQNRPVAAPVKVNNDRCVEDLCKVLGNCVQRCMKEKGEQAALSGVKCDCSKDKKKKKSKKDDKEKGRKSDRTDKEMTKAKKPPK